MVVSRRPQLVQDPRGRPVEKKQAADGAALDVLKTKDSGENFSLWLTLWDYLKRAARMLLAATDFAACT